MVRRPFSHDSKRCALISAESCHVLAAAGWRVCLILVFFNNDHNDGEDKGITNNNERRRSSCRQRTRLDEGGLYWRGYRSVNRFRTRRRIGEALIN